MALEARPGDPTSERLHAVVVPNFERLRERKIVNAKEAIRFDIEALSHKIASTKRLGSYDQVPPVLLDVLAVVACGPVSPKARSLRIGSRPFHRARARHSRWSMSQNPASPSSPHR